MDAGERERERVVFPIHAASFYGDVCVAGRAPTARFVAASLEQAPSLARGADHVSSYFGTDHRAFD